MRPVTSIWNWIILFRTSLVLKLLKTIFITLAMLFMPPDFRNLFAASSRFHSITGTKTYVIGRNDLESLPECLKGRRDGKIRVQKFSARLGRTPG